MYKIVSTVSAIALAMIPAIAAAEQSEPVSFRHGGVNYTYTVEQVGETKILRGESGASNEPFVLTVSKHWVDGTVNGSRVSFSKRSVKRIKGIVTIEEFAKR